MAAITLPITIPIRSSSLPTASVPASCKEASPPARRIYTLREYLASCRSSARSMRYEDPLEEDDAETSDGGSFSIPEMEDEDEDSDADGEDVAELSSPEPPPPAVPEKPSPLEEYVARVCSQWEDRGNGYMYGLYPKHPGSVERPWVVRYGQQAYVRAWYPVRVPGSKADFARHFWSWGSMSSMDFDELDAMGLEFLSPRSGRSTSDFPRWDFSTPQEEDDYANLLHYGSSETPAIRLLPVEEDAELPKTVAEAMAEAARALEETNMLRPGNLREVKDGSLRAVHARRMRRDWERLREKELELARILINMLDV
ncbi:hypothetical protein CALVIDRAFT_539584 [Calocera viscosa TUFC12733]|uniref:Uncharacterized protein n=1 Tax=Calocera viscosa (strain TUFC12733) TaxID=1330018 RepID=A0A167JUZ6_CALVF|nr:hypothetical protein CALVIDRAFT_539584 [Calocera viscosa TUFC12733]